MISVLVYPLNDLLVLQQWKIMRSLKFNCINRVAAPIFTVYIFMFTIFSMDSFNLGLVKLKTCSVFYYSSIQLISIKSFRIDSIGDTSFTQEFLNTGKTHYEKKVWI